MCGIFGIASEHLCIEQSELEALTNTLKHRGPDEAGFFQDRYAALGHRRLSIIDLTGGRQPIFNETNTKCIVFNGEIYNFPHLRSELILLGHQFSTKSDTETILHAYEQWGDRCVEKLRGMFAFAIWDRESKTLFMARDRLGVKPLFYGSFNGRFYFASEMKAILAAPLFPREIDEVALASYFNFSYIPAPLTIYTNIRKLPPGHILTWKNGSTSIRKYWDVFFVPDRSKSEKFFVQTCLQLLEDAVEMRLMSEVPLGAFLSGGIDSSSVVALMSRFCSNPVKTFCIGFGGNTGGHLDEREYARMVSKQYTTDHREFEVSPTPEGLIGTVIDSFDEPFADDSTIPSYFVCKMARQEVTVALSGLGGDESFAGYERHLGFALRSVYNLVPERFRLQVLPYLVDRIPERRDGHYTVNHLKRFIRSGALAPDLCYIGYLSKLQNGLGDTLFSDAEKFKALIGCANTLIRSHFNSSNVDGDCDTLNRVLYCDMKTYLAEDILALTDRMSMVHSLEVRVPFIDHVLVEFCASIPPEMKMKWFQKKYLLKKAVRHLLPPLIIKHRKQGFVGPMANWLKTDLRHFIRENLSSGNLKRHGFLNEKTVQRILDDHFSGKEIHDTLIWSMLVFQAWFDKYIF